MELNKKYRKMLEEEDERYVEYPYDAQAIIDTVIEDENSEPKNI